MHGFIAEAVELGSTVKTDGWRGYLGMDGYVHDRQIQSEQPQAIVLSRFILDEFKDKLTNKFGFTAREANHAIRLLESRCLFVNPSELSNPICRDPDDDDQIIGTAIAGSCDCIVTGDKDLSDLRKAAGIPVISPSQFWVFGRSPVLHLYVLSPGTAMTIALPQIVI